MSAAGSAEAPSLGGAEGNAPQPRLRWIREVWSSTVGKKVIVGATGVVLAAYVILHALGNLKGLQGPGVAGGEAAIDTYAEFLRTAGSPVLPRNALLWIVRILLVGALAVHVVGVSQLIRRNRAARPMPAAVVQRSFASRTMAVSGFLLLAFIVFHVLQFTTLTIETAPLAEGAVYANLYNTFQGFWMTALYVAAMAILYFHLRHALWSVLQTAGVDKPNRNPSFRRGATLTAALVAAGFAAVPVLFFAGVMPEPVGGAEGTP